MHFHSPYERYAQTKRCLLMVGGDVAGRVAWCEANVRAGYAVRPVPDATAPGLTLFEFADQTDAARFSTAFPDMQQLSEPAFEPPCAAATAG